MIRKGKWRRYLKLDIYPQSKFKQIRSQRKLNKQGTSHFRLGDGSAMVIQRSQPHSPVNLGAVGKIGRANYWC